METNPYIQCAVMTLEMMYVECYTLEEKKEKSKVKKIKSNYNYIFVTVCRVYCYARKEFSEQAVPCIYLNESVLVKTIPALRPFLKTPARLRLAKTTTVLVWLNTG